MSTSRHKLIVLILVSTALRLGWAAGLETGQDEAYHYLYSVHPDWSYFDHPPMLMYVTKIGIATFLGWLHPLSIRFGFVLLFAGSTWIMYQWTARWYGQSAGFYAALALNLSAYYTAAAGAFVLPDGPLLFFALVTMWWLSESLVASPGKFLPWVWVGLGCAGAMLSKYHAIFLPLGALVYIVVTPSAWRILRTPGPYVAALLGVMGLLPVLIWNSQHDWASFGFQTARAVGSRFDIVGVAILVFGPMALLLPWIWYGLVEVLIGRLRTLFASSGNDRYLLCQALVPLALFTAVACTRRILPHWPLIGFLPLYPLLGATWAARSVERPIFVRRWLNFMAIAVVSLALAFLLQARFGVIRFPFRDPCYEISGWDSLGHELEVRGLTSRPNTFLFTSHWYDSGHAAFAVRNRLPVACYRQGDARGFAYWSRPEDWVGMDGILIDADAKEGTVADFASYFREIQTLEPFEMTRNGRPFRTVRLFLCIDQQRPFPFAYESRNK